MPRFKVQVYKWIPEEDRIVEAEDHFSAMEKVEQETGFGAPEYWKTAQKEEQ